MSKASPHFDTRATLFQSKKCVTSTQIGHFDIRHFNMSLRYITLTKKPKMPKKTYKLLAYLVWRLKKSDN